MLFVGYSFLFLRQTGNIGRTNQTYYVGDSEVTEVSFQLNMWVRTPQHGLNNPVFGLVS